MGAWFSAAKETQTPPQTQPPTTPKVNSVLVSDSTITLGPRSAVGRNIKAIPSTPRQNAEQNVTRRGSFSRVESGEIDLGKAARGTRSDSIASIGSSMGLHSLSTRKGSRNSILKKPKDASNAKTKVNIPLHIVSSFSNMASESLHQLLPKTKKKIVSFFDFNGLMAPVFSCFRNDADESLTTANIPKYAEWLKLNGVDGILVNGLAGEAPALGVFERKVNVESWWSSAIRYNLTMMVQIGGAPLPDVLELAIHAEVLGVHGVMCLPELFYKPKTVQQLVGYCKIVARHCSSIPFFYYHIPMHTGIDLDMCEFCDLAEEEIPNFYGIQFADRDLQDARRCFREKRVVFCGISSLLGPALLMGFKSGLMTFLNIRPDLGWQIYNAYQNNDLKLMTLKQKELNLLMKELVHKYPTDMYTSAMKDWFNKEALQRNHAGFSVGPCRKLF